ncbi:hypothetical protein B0H11DRAFT_1999759 [Mycena galericulata]|nr:hypothetical protein B0H11DRAFT_2118570 [Mycena galericulata]KAJ7497905.1 hypothetical protein B0H11DRAFT_1999759 [Mycena galericulata]
MNQLPPAVPLVLQPLPVPNPALAQPNWNALSAAMQTVATETANIPNSNPLQQIVAMNANMLQLVQAFNLLQNQLVISHNAIVARLDLVPMRGHNGAATASGILQYPPGVVANTLLPVTLADALAFSGPQYIQAINHLIASNAPGLVPVPGGNNATLPAKRQHFLNYLGICCDSACSLACALDC